MQTQNVLATLQTMRVELIWTKNGQHTNENTKYDVHTHTHAHNNEHKFFHGENKLNELPRGGGAQGKLNKKHARMHEFFKINNRK